MRTTLSCFIVALAISGIINCKGEPKHLGTPEHVIEAELKERRQKLINMRKPTYAIANTSETRDAAVRKLIQSLVQGDMKKVNGLVFTPKEYRDILFPNLPERYNMNPGLPPQFAAEFAGRNRFIGLSRLQKRLAGKRVKLLRVKWKENVSDFRVLKGHRIDRVYVSINGREEPLSQIRIVTEHNGRYKVAVVNNG